MIDPRLLRQDIEGVAERVGRRGFELDVAWFREREDRRKALQVETERLQNERRTISKRIGAAKAAGEDAGALIATVGDLGERLVAVKAGFEAVRADLDAWELTLPNVPNDAVPPGKGRRGQRGTAPLAHAAGVQLRAERPR